ncbi:MAG: toxic anion resistance protein, partial [Clostridiales bacterium]|nr:toxic anion resistance protein [Clostridiales bacterium]
AELIQTLDDVMKIQADGRAKRLAAEAEMAKMENDLKVKLLQIRNGG